MRIILLSFALIFSAALFATDKVVSPLLPFSEKWANSKYDAANTAKDASYMTDPEKQVIQILNLMKMDPQLFLETVILKYPVFTNNADLSKNSYYRSLLKDMADVKAMTIMTPDAKCYESAFCHAASSGPKAYVGHNRQTAECKEKSFYFGECIFYGSKDPLDIVMSLLIDENVPNLGHRKIFLTDYKTAGVSIQPHNRYRYNAVIDFGY